MNLRCYVFTTKISIAIWFVGVLFLYYLLPYVPYSGWQIPADFRPISFLSDSKRLVICKYNVNNLDLIGPLEIWNVNGAKREHEVEFAGQKVESVGSLPNPDRVALMGFTGPEQKPFLSI